METCFGCGAQSERHPVAGIGRADMDNDSGALVSYPICAECHANPEHRKRNLKCHFHQRSQETLGLAAARVVEEMSKAGQDIALG
jgi:hypothetical protein